MDESEQLLWHRKILRVLFWLTWFIYVPPLALYGVARLNGTLPSEAVWEKQGGNHGPWWGETPGDVLLFWILVMAAFEVATFFFALNMNRKTPSPFSIQDKAMLLTACQFVIGFAVFMVTYWTID